MKNAFFVAEGVATVRLNGKHSDKCFVVDERDVDLVASHSWSGRPSGATLYVASKRGSLHRLILGLGPVNPEVDHFDGDGLNNRRSNLRTATRQGNCANRSKWGSRSRYKGVQPRNGGWEARHYLNGRTVYIGVFGSEEEAAKAYDAAALRVHGEFARLNFKKEFA